MYVCMYTLHHWFINFTLREIYSRTKCYDTKRVQSSIESIQEQGSKNRKNFDENMATDATAVGRNGSMFRGHC